MKLFTGIATASVFVLAQACSQPDDSASEQTNEENTEAAESETYVAEAGEPTTCPIVSSRDWTAWVNAMPGPDAQATLIVEGVVDTPTPGYAFSWEVGVADRSAIPMQRLHLSATPPDGMAAQVITTGPVRYQGPAIAQRYRAVVVMCSEEMLAEITDVATAQ